MNHAAGAGRRADVLMVDRGLVRSRTRAQELIAAGRVHVDGSPVRKPSDRLAPDADVLIEPGEDWVGRAAHKLLGALEEFGPQGLDVTGRTCIDVGASTGGFTQVLLARGARHVVALDVGHGQLDDTVANDPRVTERSGTNVRDTTSADLGGPAEVVVSDLSFISLRLVLERLAELTAPHGHLVLLVKPQFEVGRDALGRGGVVRDPVLRAGAVRGVLDVAARHELSVHGLAPSPLVGTHGNREYLLWARREAAGMMTRVDIDAQLDRIAQEAP